MYLFGCAGCWLRHTGSLAVACEIYFPDQGLNPWRPALGAWRLSHWTTREVPWKLFLFNFSTSVSVFSQEPDPYCQIPPVFKVFCCGCSLLVSYPHPCSHAHVWLVLFYQASFTFPLSSFSKLYVGPSSANVSFHDTYIFVFWWVCLFLVL